MPGMCGELSCCEKHCVLDVSVVTAVMLHDWLGLLSVPVATTMMVLVVVVSHRGWT